MAKLAVKKATVDVSVYVFIQNSSVTTGAGLTGLIYNSAGLVCYYVRPLASAAALTLATQTVTGAHSDGGFIEVDATNMPGVYRLDLSDAICATGVNSVVVMLKGATNMVPVALEIQLVSYDPNDAIRAGLTALPNAAAEAAGGLYTRGTGAGQINQPANGQIDANTVKVGGTVQTAGDIPARLPAALVSGRMDSSVGAVAAGVDLSATMKASVQTECIAAIVAKKLDRLIAASGSLVVAGGHTTTAVYSDDLPAASHFADYHNGQVMLFLTGQNAGASRKINDTTWDGFQNGFDFSGTANAWPRTPADGDTFVILAISDEQMRGTNGGALAFNYTATRAGYLDLINTNLNATVSSRSSHSAADVWTSATRTLTALGSGPVAEIWNALTSGMVTIGSIGKRIVDYLTGDIFARLGAPAGASVSADIAAVKSDTGTIVTNVAAILDDTGTSGVVLTAAERTAIADALLSRDMSLVAGVAQDSRKVLNALRTLRNKVTIVGTTLTVYAENDTTVAYTATITTDAAALPIIASDPA